MDAEKIEALVEKWVEFLTHTLVAEGPGLSAERQEFANRSRKLFPEFFWKWAEDGVVTVYVYKNDPQGELETEDYFTACARIVDGVHGNSADIPESRQREFVTFALVQDIRVRFKEVAELPREVIHRVNKRVFG
jgi:hypothetical protein